VGRILEHGPGGGLRCEGASCHNELGGGRHHHWHHGTHTQKAIATVAPTSHEIVPMH